MFPQNYVTEEQLKDLKDQVNDSFAEVANLLLEVMRRQDMIEERLENHNRRGGHKI